MLQWFIDNQELATLLFTGVVAVSTVIYAILTAYLVIETIKMRKVQTEPKIAVYFGHMEDLINFGNLYVQNIGLGPAYNISFKIEHEGSDKGAELLLNDFLTTKFFERGLNYLGPGQKVKSHFTALSSEFEVKVKTVLIVKVQYASSTSDKHSDEYRIDFSEIEGVGQLGKSNLYTIANSIEQIQKDVSNLVTGFKKIEVNIYDRDDRNIERRKDKEFYRNIGKNNDDDLI